MKTSKKILSRIGLLVVALAVCVQLSAVWPQLKSTTPNNVQFACQNTPLSTNISKLIVPLRDIITWMNNFLGQ